MSLALAVFFGGATPLLCATQPTPTQKIGQQVSAKHPVNISSYQLTFDRPEGLTLFTGDVKAVHDKVVLLADEIRALEENREATASGHVKVVDHSQGVTLTCGNLEYQDLMDLMTAHDHPLLTTLDERGVPITVLGRQMEVDSVEKTVTINQNVQIIHKDGKAEAQKATFLSSQDKFILEDDPKVYTDNGLLSGRRIVSNLGGDRSVFVEGMADAIFNPNGKPVTNNKSGAATAAAPGRGTTPGNPAFGSGPNGAAPNNSEHPAPAGGTNPPPPTSTGAGYAPSPGGGGGGAPPRPGGAP